MFILNGIFMELWMLDEYGLCLCYDFYFKEIIFLKRRDGGSFKMVFCFF